MIVSENNDDFLFRKFSAMSVFETEAYKAGYRYVIGIDEAGRGPLAGPVLAVACYLPPGKFFPGVDDSKKMTSSGRKKIKDLLLSDKEVSFGIGLVEAPIIDRINILQATKQAMREAVDSCRTPTDFLLIDGMNFDINGLPSRGIVKGDALCVSIAAASVLAKEFRDEIMLRYHKEYPEYGFERHKGYGTAVHLAALKKFGPTPIHRKSFSPVAKCKFQSPSYCEASV
ncbi:MAG: ribonuclease HII [Victivallaceae bacterium]